MTLVSDVGPRAPWLPAHVHRTHAPAVVQAAGSATMAAECPTARPVVQAVAGIPWHACAAPLDRRHSLHQATYCLLLTYY